MKLNVGEAIVRWMIAQQVVCENALGGAPETRPYFGGVMAIFGHGNALCLGDALSRHREQITTWRGQNEQGMALAAVGYAKARHRQQALAVTTSIGPGALNVVTAAGTAMANRLPLFILAGDTFHSRLPDPVLQQIETFSAPSVTANDCLRPVTRYWDRITAPSQVLSSLPQALATLLDPATCGPVCICLPQDVQAQTYDFPDEFFEPTVHRIPRPRADHAEVMAALQAITEARRPLIIAGGGVHYSGAQALLATFAEGQGIPVVETVAGKSSLLASHPCYVGPVGVTGSDAANALVQAADLIVAVGTRLQDFTTGSGTLLGSTRIVSINVSRHDAAKRHALQVVGDARATLSEIMAKLRKSPPLMTNAVERASWQKQVGKRKAEVAQAIEARMQQGSELPTYAQVIGAVHAQASEHDYVVAAAGGLPGELNGNWMSKGVATFDCEYGFSCMGYEISGAWGAALARKYLPEGRVLALCGDGSYLMLSSDVYSAVLSCVPLTLVVCDNGGYAVISRLQESQGLASFRTMLTESAGAPRVDFAAHAASMGAETHKVSSTTELGEVLARTRSALGVVVIVIETAPSAWTEGGAFWELGVPEGDARPAVQEAHERQLKGKEQQRKY